MTFQMDKKKLMSQNPIKKEEKDLTPLLRFL